MFERNVRVIKENTYDHSTDSFVDAIGVGKKRAKVVFDALKDACDSTETHCKSSVVEHALKKCESLEEAFILGMLIGRNDAQLEDANDDDEIDKW